MASEVFLEILQSAAHVPIYAHAACDLLAFARATSRKTLAETMDGPDDILESGLPIYDTATSHR